MTVLFVVLALAILALSAMLAVGRLGELAPPEVDGRIGSLPESAGGQPRAEDVRDVRFAVTVRGYRMDQVDAVLDQLARELTARDVTIEQLRARIGDADSVPSSADAAEAADRAESS